MLKKIVVLAVIFAVASVLFSCTYASNPGSPAVSPTPDVNGFYTATSAGMTFKWKVNGSNLECKLTGPTAGWISVAFNTSGVMDGSDYAIGYVTGGTTVTLSDQHGSAHTHTADTIQNFTAITGTDNGSTTEIDFTRPLNSGDTQDMVLTQGMNVWLILAYGSSDDLTSIHTAFGTVQTTLY